MNLGALKNSTQLSNFQMMSEISKTVGELFFMCCKKVLTEEVGMIRSQRFRLECKLQETSSRSNHTDL